jgi:hypothetical protein
MTTGMKDVPFALFTNHGRLVAMTREEYKQASAIARICRCGTCDCCRAVEYVREATKNGEQDA